MTIQNYKNIIIGRWEGGKSEAKYRTEALITFWPRFKPLRPLSQLGPDRNSQFADAIGQSGPFHPQLGRCAFGSPSDPVRFLQSP
jgi:hypothetical protein